MSDAAPATVAVPQPLLAVPPAAVAHNVAATAATQAAAAHSAAATAAATAANAHVAAAKAATAASTELSVLTGAVETFGQKALAFVKAHWPIAAGVAAVGVGIYLGHVL